MDLASRDTIILQHVVELFVGSAEPVSSSGVAQRLTELTLSPASVRAIMAELEARGFLEQPHTSAGRVPTEKGIRVYLDHLGRRKVGRRDRNALDATVATANFADFPASLGHSLACLSGQVAVVAKPRLVGESLKEVGLIRHDSQSFLAVLVSHGGVIQQKKVELDFEVDSEQLSWAQNFLNDELKKKSVAVLREQIRSTLDGQQDRDEDLRQKALQIVVCALPGPDAVTDLDVIVEGVSHLVGQPEFADLDRLRHVLEVLEERRVLLELVDRVLDSRGVQVMLGSEHQISDLPAVAWVGVPSLGPAGNTAAVTLLGPSRMNYGRLVPMVDYAAQLFGRYWQGF